MGDLEQIRVRAIDWHVRLRDGDADVWEAFSEWLGEDPNHGEAYDRVEAIDLAVEPLLSQLVFREAANDSAVADVESQQDMRRSWKRRWVVGGAIAAAVVVLAMLTPMFVGTDRYIVRTVPGERRTVVLDAGTRVVLNGATTMEFDRNDPRFSSLVTGEALFHVRHDEARPFTLHVGDDRIRDAGTVFNVVKAPDGIRVAVSEGKVIYNPDAESVPLTSGQLLVAAEGSANASVEEVPSEAVGAWERGRFIYDGEPLCQVAADLERSLGVRIAVDPAIADRPVSGSLVVDGKGAGQIARLENALDLSIVTGPGGWTMKPASGALR